MSRPSVAVRHASVADLPSLDPLWDELVAALGDGPARTAASRLRERVATGAADQQLVVALAGGVPVGLLTYAVVDQGPWGEAPSLVIGLLHVQARSRRRGVAKALLGWVAAHADEGERACQRGGGRRGRLEPHLRGDGERRRRVLGRQRVRPTGRQFDDDAPHAGGRRRPG